MVNRTAQSDCDKMDAEGGPTQPSGQQAKADGGEMDALLLGRLQELQVSGLIKIATVASFV